MWDGSYSTVGSAYTLHEANLGLIPNTCGLSLPVVILGAEP